MSRRVNRWELDQVTGSVVVVDVIRAFSTAAYAFGAGAAEIYLVASVDEALAFKAAHRDVLAMGEDGGLRPDGFDFPNSPAMVASADLGGRTLVSADVGRDPGSRGCRSRRTDVGGESGRGVGNGERGGRRRAR